MITCIAIDDEPLALERIVRLINENKNLQLIGQFNSIKELEKALLTNVPELLFLDIQLPGKTGLEFAQQLTYKLPIIFTTAYDNYAINGFDLDVVDYLLKPISNDRFKIACEKAELRIKNRLNEPNYHGFIMVSSEHQNIKIEFSNILYIEGLKDYIKIFTTQSIKPILSRQNLKTFESKLPQNLFSRVHKSFIITLNQNHIQSATYQNVIINSVKLPLGNSYKGKFVSVFFKENLI